MSYDRTNVSQLARELGVTAPQLYKSRKEFEEFGEGSIKRVTILKIALAMRLISVDLLV